MCQSRKQLPFGATPVCCAEPLEVFLYSGVLERGALAGALFFGESKFLIDCPNDENQAEIEESTLENVLGEGGRCNPSLAFPDAPLVVVPAVVVLAVALILGLVVEFSDEGLLLSTEMELAGGKVGLALGVGVDKS